MAAAISAIPKARPRTQIRFRPLPPTRPVQARTFRSTASIRGRMTDVRLPSGASSALPLQQGMKAQMKSLGRNQMPGDDFGVVPMTFIRPTNDILPSLFGSDWKYRLRIEWLQRKIQFQNFVALYGFLRVGKKRDPLTKKKMKEAFRFVERTAVARDLHKKFYTALAAGDVATINTIACSGLQRYAKMQIDQRNGAGAPPRKFQILKYRGITYPQWLRWPLLTILPFHSTKIISDKASLMPYGAKDNSIRQFVIRLKTRQSLDNGGGKGLRVADLTEYVVIQKIRISGNDEPWKIWGTVQTSTLSEIDEMFAINAGTAGEGVMDRMRAVSGGMLGG